MKIMKIMKKRIDRQILISIMVSMLVGFLNLILVSASASDIPGAISVEVQAQTNESNTIQKNSVPDRKIFQIAAVAKRGKEKAIKKWQPTADYLTEHISDYKFVVKPYDWDEIRRAVANGIPDFVLTNPGMYVEFEALYDVRRIATLKNLRLGKPYTSFGVVFFRLTDRVDIVSIEDIRGKSLSAVNETAWGGWQVGWRQLLEMGIDPYKDLSALSFAGSHDNVVLAVRDKKVDIGAVRTDTLERMASEGRIDLGDFTPICLNLEYGDSFPFWLSTKLYPEWPFATASHTAMELNEKVAIALMSIIPGHRL